LKSKFSTLSSNSYGYRKKLPSFFAEQWVAMFATIPKTRVATQVNIDMINAFFQGENILQLMTTKIEYLI